MSILRRLHEHKTYARQVRNAKLDKLASLFMREKWCFIDGDSALDFDLNHPKSTE